MISYFNKLVSNAVLKEVTRPVAKGAWHSIFAPFRPDLMKEHDLKPGEMLLADGKKKEKIKWNVDGKEETVTIEEALKRIKAEEDPMRQKKMEDDLSLIVQRTPTDSPSGARPIKIVGFSNIPGATAVLHPKDLANLGGADLDIDKGFIYKDIPAEVKAEFRKVSNEWYDYYHKSQVGKKNQKPINTGKMDYSQIQKKVQSGEWVEVMKDAKESDVFR